MFDHSGTLFHLRRPEISVDRPRIRRLPSSQPPIHHSMPSSQPRSGIPSPPPPATPTATPLEPALCSKSRSSSRTPGPTTHHHRTADEIALQEAADLLHATPSALTRDGVDLGSVDGSARSLRHRKLIEARHHQAPVHRGDTPEGDEAVAEEGEAGDLENEPEINGNNDERSGLDGVGGQADGEFGPGPAIDFLSARDTVPIQGSESKRLIAETDSESEADSSITDASESDSYSETSASVIEEEEEEEEEKEEEEERLDKLLQAAAVSALAERGAREVIDGEEDGMMLRIHQPGGNGGKEALVHHELLISLRSPVDRENRQSYPRYHYPRSASAATLIRSLGPSSSSFG